MRICSNARFGGFVACVVSGNVVREEADAMQSLEIPHAQKHDHQAERDPHPCGAVQLQEVSRSMQCNRSMDRQDGHETVEGRIRPYRSGRGVPVMDDTARILGIDSYTSSPIVSVSRSVDGEMVLKYAAYEKKDHAELRYVFRKRTIDPSTLPPKKRYRVMTPHESVKETRKLTTTGISEDSIAKNGTFTPRKSQRKFAVCKYTARIPQIKDPISMKVCSDIHCNCNHGTFKNGMV